MRFFYLLFFLPFLSIAQSSYAPLNEDYYHWIDRYEVKAGRIYPQIFTSIKPYKRSDIIAFIDSVNSQNVFQSRADQFNREYLTNDSWEWSPQNTNESTRPILKHFYKKKSDLYNVNTKDFDLHVNPVLYVGAGNDSRRNDMLFVNTRGVEVRGMVDKKVGFYTYLTDNQAILPSYVADEMALKPVIPHEGFWKNYKNGKGVDFLQARGYVTFEATKHINIQFGHDRFFFGNGIRSLIFSDFQPPALFLKGNVKVWKINYMFLLNKMTTGITGSLNGISGTTSGFPSKYNALHHLSINIGKKLNLGIFESVIFSKDNPGTSSEFRAEYLNPIIFYRAIEQQNGSSDNVLLGFDFKWNALKKISFYGQFLLDEFLIDNIRKGGWWANKFGVQAGAKCIDAFGVSNLDLQGEINIVRPYTYSHYTAFGNYSSYNQPIAHPMGANLNEIIGSLRYQPIPRLNVVAKLFLTKVGRDSLNGRGSYGADILKNNSLRYSEFGNTIGQGISTTVSFATLTASFQLRHNIFIDANFTLRKSKSAYSYYNTNTNISSVALRWNIPRRLYEF
jgi:hypothetical protein